MFTKQTTRTPTSGRVDESQADEVLDGGPLVVNLYPAHVPVQRALEAQPAATGAATVALQDDHAALRQTLRTPVVVDVAANVIIVNVAVTTM